MNKSFRYVHTFVLPLPRKSVSKYKKMAKVFAKVWKDYGAIDYYECLADEVDPGEQTSFSKSVHLKKNETIVMGWATFASKARYERCMKAVMEDPRLKPYMDPDAMPFDGMRMFWGAFKRL